MTRSNRAQLTPSDLEFVIQPNWANMTRSNRAQLTPSDRAHPTESQPSPTERYPVGVVVGAEQKNVTLRTRATVADPCGHGGY
jgi:hypothetical protein